MLDLLNSYISIMSNILCWICILWEYWVLFLQYVNVLIMYIPGVILLKQWPALLDSNSQVIGSNPTHATYLFPKVSMANGYVCRQKHSCHQLDTFKPSSANILWEVYKQHCWWHLHVRQRTYAFANSTEVHVWVEF